MFANFCRRIFGGVRLALTVIVLMLGGAIVIADVFFAPKVSGAAYAFLGGLVAQVIAFEMMETKRRSGE